VWGLPPPSSSAPLCFQQGFSETFYKPPAQHHQPNYFEKTQESTNLAHDLGQWVEFDNDELLLFLFEAFIEKVNVLVFNLYEFIFCGFGVLLAYGIFGFFIGKFCEK
jgi:hypothetical protein